MIHSIGFITLVSDTKDIYVMLHLFDFYSKIGGSKLDFGTCTKTTLLNETKRWNHDFHRHIFFIHICLFGMKAFIW